jgi:hypothetical protein
VDWELLQLIGIILFGAAGLVYAGLAGWYYLLTERRQMNGVPVALAAFMLSYGLAYSLTISALQLERLLPTIITFGIAIALVVAISVGIKAHSKAGTRIAIAGMFTLGAYFCLTIRFFTAH